MISPDDSADDSADSARSRSSSLASAGDAKRSTGSAGALLESSDLYRLLVDRVRDYAIFALDTTGHVLSWNEGAQRLKGYAANEIIGRHFSTFYPQYDIDNGKPAWELETAIRDGRFEDEGWRIRKDGSRMWANVVITALFDDDGTHVGFAKVTRDLTERRAAEETLRTSEERFRLLVQGVLDYAIFMLSPSGIVVSWNEGAQSIKGYAASEIIGKHFSTFYPAEDIESGKPALELLVASREGRYEEEGWRLRKDGTRFWANVLITAVRNPAGELIGFAKVTRDLTERRAAEEKALADTRRITEAEVSNRTKSEFLAAMSHELRTPLNAIGGYAELIAMGIGGPITELQRDYLSRIRASQQHLLGIITELLNFSRIDAGQVAYDLMPVSVQSMVDNVLPLLAPQAEAKQLTLSSERASPLILATADRLRTEQIMLNLMSNAIKFTQPGGTVTVRCTGESDSVSIAVEDSGVGIPSEKLRAIFEPFVQLGRTRTSQHEGTGLGLAISRDLARAMGGDVTVESTVGQGSTFTLMLPRAM